MRTGCTSEQVKHANERLRDAGYVPSVIAAAQTARGTRPL